MINIPTFSFLKFYVNLEFPSNYTNLPMTAESSLGRGRRRNTHWSACREPAAACHGNHTVAAITRHNTKTHNLFLVHPHMLLVRLNVDNHPENFHNKEILLLQNASFVFVSQKIQRPLHEEFWSGFRCGSRRKRRSLTGYNEQVTLVRRSYLVQRPSTLSSVDQRYPAGVGHVRR